MTDARLLLPSLDGGLCAEKVEPLGSDYTRSNRPIWVLECNNKGQVQAGGVGEGRTNPRWKLSDGKMPCYVLGPTFSSTSNFPMGWAAYPSFPMTFALIWTTYLLRNPSSFPDDYQAFPSRDLLMTRL